jgi:hypothetical protein
MNCDETREHLDACEECRLHVAVEARLRTLPVLEPPAGLAARVMKAVPRHVPLGRELRRLAAAAAILFGLTVGVYAMGLHRHERVDASIAEVKRTVAAFSENFGTLGSELWK